MPEMAWPSLASRTRPMKLATAPTSTRPRVSDSSSRPTSKSCSWTRTVGMLAARDRRKEGHLVARLDGRGGIRHALVHGHAPRLRGSERLAPARVAGAQLLDQRGHRSGRPRQRHLLARTAEALAQAREVEQ